MNKKGSIIDIVFVLVVLVFFGIVVLVGSKIGTEVNEIIQDNSEIDANTKEQSQRTISNSMGSIDNAFLFLVIFLAIGILILAALVRVHPIFIPIFFVAWVMIIFLSGILANIYLGMAETAQFADIASQMTFMHNIISVLPLIIGVFGIFLMVVMYKLWSAAQ